MNQQGSVLKHDLSAIITFSSFEAFIFNITVAQSFPQEIFHSFPKTCLPFLPCPQMFLKVRSSGSSHEETHLERGKHQPSNAAKGKVLKEKKTTKTNAVSRPVSWLNCPRAEWRECVPAKACRFAPYWNPVPPGPLFGERRSEGCVCCNKRTKSWMGKKSFWLRRT